MQNHVAELTFKSIVIAILLTFIMTAANTFLGLKVGTTISASIPAAIMSMGILRFFKNHNVYEINMAQTAAATGEALASGMIFSLPALLLIHYWNVFNFWESSSIALIGGILGVLFATPLRRVLLNDKSLKFPEGTAIGNILKITQDKTLSLQHLLIGSILGAVIAFLEGGLKILSSGIHYWTKLSQTVVGTGLGFSPALIGAGFIVGPGVAISVLIGVIIGWMVLVPALAPMNAHALSELSAQALATDVWRTQVRFAGLGVLLVAGIWTLITLLKPILQGVAASYHSIQFAREHGYDKLPRHEQDIPIHWALGVVILMILPILFTLLYATDVTTWMTAHLGQLGIATFTTAYILFAGFIFASICGYLVGMVGASASPISAMGLAAILIYSMVIFAVLKFSGFDIDGNTLSLSALAIVVVGFITCIGAITNDTMQDLKAGQMINATPWKQQLVMFIGVAVAAYSTPWVMDLLYSAYGIGDRLPRPDMDINQSLAAPQAQLMAAIAQGVFMQNLSWIYIEIGAAIAVLGIIVDKMIRRYGLSLPTLGLGLGVYLPIETSTALVLGGIIAWAVSKRVPDNEHDGIMLASGLVTGAALMGVALAIPFVIFQNTDALRVMPVSLMWLSQALGLLTTAGLCYFLYRKS